MITKLKKLFGRGDAEEDLVDVEAEANLEDDWEEDEEHVFARDEKDERGWIGIGLDGVLAERTAEGLRGEIGRPVANMVARVRDWVDYKGLRVCVLTPRAATAEGAAKVEAWLRKNDLDWLDFTHAKDLHMVEFWDDRAVQVISNLGTRVGESPNGLDPGPDVTTGHRPGSVMQPGPPPPHTLRPPGVR